MRAFVLLSLLFCATAYPDPQPLNAAAILSAQPERLRQALTGISSSQNGAVDLYFLGVAAYGRQDVFMNEVRYAEHLFEHRFNARGRALSLINNPATLSKLPIASITNLEYALAALAQRMNVKEDILFLYITSHGYRGKRVAVEFPPLPPTDLASATLAELLSKSGFYWKVIVVSACYSGGFIDALADQHTLVITSAGADSASFGCSNEAEFTYFGRALLQEALSRSASFVEAFEQAKRRVAQREASQGYQPSQPQIHVGAKIEKKLAAWRSSLTPQSALSSFSDAELMQ